MPWPVFAAIALGAVLLRYVILPKLGIKGMPGVSLPLVNNDQSMTLWGSPGPGNIAVQVPSGVMVYSVTSDGQDVMAAAQAASPQGQNLVVPTSNTQGVIVVVLASPSGLGNLDLQALQLLTGQGQSLQQLQKMGMLKLVSYTIHYGP